MWQRDMKWANAVGKNGTNRLAWYRVATNLQFVKNAVFVKCSKAKHNKTRYAYMKKKKQKLEGRSRIPVAQVE